MPRFKLRNPPPHEQNKDNEDQETTLALMKNIQNKWKTIGHIPRKDDKKNLVARYVFWRNNWSILPSSLAMNLSSTLEYSSQLPVSVYGTGCFSRFSWKLLLWIITLTEASVYYRGITTRFNVLFRQYAPNLHLRHF